MRLKESWRHWSNEQSKDFLRSGPEGKAHRSRAKTLSLLDGMSSVLDVGCGSTDHYERKARYGPRIRHLIGIDVIANLGTNESLDYVTRASVYNLPFRSFQFDEDFCLQLFGILKRHRKPG